MRHKTTDTLTRRRLLKSGAGAVAAGVAVTGTASAQEAPYGGHLSEATNFEGQTADATGQSEVTVNVGTEDGFRFTPPALLVDPGTTVRWNWTGQGGLHNVVHDEQSDLVDESLFRSGDPVSEEGINFEFTFEDEGVYPYVCIPHRSLGMFGVIVVGEDNVETETFQFGEADEQEEERNLTAILGGSAVFGVAALGGVAAYRDLVGDDGH